MCVRCNEEQSGVGGLSYLEKAQGYHASCMIRQLGYTYKQLPGAIVQRRVLVGHASASLPLCGRLEVRQEGVCRGGAGALCVCMCLGLRRRTERGRRWQSWTGCAIAEGVVGGEVELQVG